MKKLRWIDVAKGIGILLVILEHSMIEYTSFFARIILLFHMPFFFFIAGYCYNQSLIGEKLAAWRKRKIYFSIKIYAVFSLFGLVFYTSMDMIMKSFSWESWLRKLVNSFYINRIHGEVFMGGGWYFTTWIVTTILFSILWDRILRRIRLGYQIVLLILLAVGASLTNSASISYLPLCLDNAKFALIFFYFGVVMNSIIKKYKWSAETVHNKTLLFFFVDVVLIILLVGITHHHGECVYMYINSYGNYFLFFAGAIIGIVALVLTSILIERVRISNIASFFGCETLYYYLMHFSYVYVVIRVVSKYIKNPMLGTMLVFFIVCFTLIPTNYILKKTLSPLLQRDWISLRKKRRDT